MKGLIAKTFGSLLLLILCAVSGAAQKTPQALVTDFVHAWNTHDMKAFDRIFTDDAVWVTLAENRISGRVDIVKDFTIAHTTWAMGSSLVQSDVEVRRLGNDAAVVLFRAGFLDDRKQLVPDSKRALLIVVVKQKGAWKISAGQLAHPTPKA